MLKKTILVLTVVSSLLYSDGAPWGNSSGNVVQDGKIGIDQTYLNNAIFSTGDSSTKGSVDAISVMLGKVKLDKISVTTLPLTFDITDNIIINGSVAYIKNDHNDKKGMGDSSVGIGYKLFFENSRSIINFSIGIPTGDIKDYTGTGGLLIHCWSICQA